MRTLVVGLDGGPDSLAALTWASQTVGDEGVVHAVRAVDTPQADPLPNFPTVWRNLANVPGVSIETHVLRGDPVGILLALAAQSGADAIVVGPHHHPHPSPRRVGKVAAGLLAQTDRPVIVVRDGAAHQLTAGGNIVVGVGSGAATNAAVQFAARHAAARGMSLTLVHVLGAPSLWRPEDLFGVLAYQLDPRKLVEWAEEDLADLAHELRTSVDGRLPVEWRTTSGRLGPSLVDAAADASLLVIGLRRGSFSDHFTAPAMHHTLTHAPCPVAVVVAVE